jgi:hypothetical protein
LFDDQNPASIKDFVDASTIFVTTSTKLMQKAGQRIDFVPFSSMFLA